MNRENEKRLTKLGTNAEVMHRENKKQPAEWYVAEATFVIMWAAHTQHPESLEKSLEKRV